MGRPCDAPGRSSVPVGGLQPGTARSSAHAACSGPAAPRPRAHSEAPTLRPPAGPLPLPASCPAPRRMLPHERLLVLERLPQPAAPPLAAPPPKPESSPSPPRRCVLHTPFVGPAGVVLFCLACHWKEVLRCLLPADNGSGELGGSAQHDRGGSGKTTAAS
jgi:hypothetical protein